MYTVEKPKTPYKCLTDTSRLDTEEFSKKNIQVSCRVRPLGPKESSQSEKPFLDISCDQRSITVKNQHDSLNHLNFTYDRVFPPEVSQKVVYEEIGRPIVESVMEGFNGTILAYGQTSSGKTYTMMGSEISDATHKGLIPRMVCTVFQNIKEADAALEFSVKLAFCEIYLEKIKDLLIPSKKNLKISEDRARGIYIQNLSEEYVSHPGEVLALLKIGNKNREVASTLMNEESSRSHAIFLITVTITNTLDFSVKTGKMYLVDLAGSEKLSKTGAEGKRLDETKNINKSLSTLGNVICSLTDGKSTHIPYRDSKLTRVLQDSLGGNSKTSLIITCSPAGINEQETLSTLRFGIRAKAVKNKPTINKELSISQLKLLLDKANECIVQKENRIEWLEKNIRERRETCLEGLEGKEESEEGEGEARYWNGGRGGEIEGERSGNQFQSSERLKRELESQITKNKNLARENDKLNSKIVKFGNLIQEYEERMQDMNEDCNKLESKTCSQEKQISCLLDTNRNLDKKIEEMQCTINEMNMKTVKTRKFKTASGINTIPKDVFTTEYNAITSFLEDINTVFKEKKMNFEQAFEFCNKKLELLTMNHKKNEIYLESYIPYSRNLVENDEEYNEILRISGQENISKVYSLEKNLEQLNLMYNILSHKYTATRADLSTYEKKVIRKNERISVLEKSLHNTRELANRYKYKLEASLTEDTESQAGIAQSQITHSKIKKMIKGGGSITAVNILCPYSTNTS